MHKRDSPRELKVETKLDPQIVKGSVNDLSPETKATMLKNRDKNENKKPQKVEGLLSWQTEIRSIQRLEFRPVTNRLIEKLKSIVKDSENAAKPVNFKIEINQNEFERLEYQKALEINRKLAVNANKYNKSKCLMLFTVIEKDES